MTLFEKRADFLIRMKRAMIKNGIPERAATQSIEDAATNAEYVFFHLPLGFLIIIFVFVALEFFTDTSVWFCNGSFEYSAIILRLFLLICFVCIGSSLFILFPRPVRFKKTDFIIYFYRQFLTLGQHRAVKKANGRVAEQADFEGYYNTLKTLRAKWYLGLAVVFFSCAFLSGFIMPKVCT